MKEILLGKGQIAFVDDKDFESISSLHWYLHNGYAKNDRQSNNKRIRTSMHRMVMGENAGKYTDHINGNKLDNRRENLRICTNAQNMRNIAPKKQNSSGFKGVTWQKDCSRWKAQIKVNYKNIHIGIFKIKEDAARAYNEAAKKYFGDFAWLNIV